MMLSKLNTEDRRKLQECIKSHSQHPFPDGHYDQLRFMVLALCGESGELADYIKKEWRGDISHIGYDEWKAKVTSEVADIGNYIFMIARIIGVDLLDVMLSKFIEVENRPTWKGPKTNV